MLVQDDGKYNMSYDEGMKLFKSGNYRAAAEQFATVTEADENNHKAWNALGICLSKIGEYEQAAVCFDNAVTLAPENATYLKNQAGNEKKRMIAEPDLELDVGPAVKSQPSKKPCLGYQRNWLQIPLYFIPMILSVANIGVGFLAVICCAYYIKTDADSLNAGSNPNASIWGRMKGWEWMLLFIFFWLFMPLYSWKREQIYNENLGYGTSSSVATGSHSIIKIGAGIGVFLFFCIIVSAFVFGMSGAVSENQPVKTIKTSNSIQPASTNPVIEQTQNRATPGERNAARKAQAYLDYTAFSYSGLIKQLEFEKFSHSEAVYGADQTGADWNEQAAKKAQIYLDYSSFSRDGLINQLLFEGFTQQQAEYGVKAVGY